MLSQGVLYSFPPRVPQTYHRPSLLASPPYCFFSAHLGGFLQSFQRAGGHCPQGREGNGRHLWCCWCPWAWGHWLNFIALGPPLGGAPLRGGDRWLRDCVGIRRHLGSRRHLSGPAHRFSPPGGDAPHTTEHHCEPPLPCGFLSGALRELGCRPRVGCNAGWRPLGLRVLAPKVCSRKP